MVPHGVTCRPARSRHFVRPLATPALIGLFITLFLAWTLPMALLRWGVERHTVGRLHPWTSPSGVACGAFLSHATFSDACTITRNTDPEASLPPTGGPAHIPSWAGAPPESEENVYHIYTGATGWPLRAFASESRFYLVPDDTSTFRWCEDLRYSLILHTGPRDRIILPLCPIWRGLLADIAIFALAWSSLVATLRTTRSALRTRRGLCPHCAYDLRATAPHSPCPECGSPVRPR